MRKILHSFTIRMQIWVDCWWYPILMFFVALADLFLFIIPSDGILISSVLARPRRWVSLSLGMALGTTAGGLIFTIVLKDYGVDVIHLWMPSLTESWAWKQTEYFFADYGLWVLFFFAATPLSIQPALFFSVMAGTGILPIFIVTLIGRIIKNGLLGGIASKAPTYLNRLWGIRKDMEEVGLSHLPPSKDAKR